MEVPSFLSIYFINKRKKEMIETGGKQEDFAGNVFVRETKLMIGRCALCKTAVPWKLISFF
jgi:hypothetical protein